MSLEIRSVVPKFEDNYDVGWIGFQFTDNSFVSNGIAWFERWDRLGDIRVSHCFVVSGYNKCIEALAHGVTESTLEERFADPHVHVFFRVPLTWDQKLGESIVASAREHLGHKYGYALIVAHFLASTLIGRLVNKLTGGWPNRLMTRICNGRLSEICSELMALAMQAQPRLSTLGCLARPAREVRPQVLFEDGLVFQPWKKSV